MSFGLVGLTIGHVNLHLLSRDTPINVLRGSEVLENVFSVLIGSGVRHDAYGNGTANDLTDLPATPHSSGVGGRNQVEVEFAGLDDFEVLCLVASNIELLFGPIDGVVVDTARILLAMDLHQVGVVQPHQLGGETTGLCIRYHQFAYTLVRRYN
jgi:hypothetical protein